MAGTSLGTAYVQIVPKAEGIKGSIENVLSGEAQASGLSAGSKIGAFMKKALVAAGVGAAFAKVVKGAMDEGAKLQQSYIGGLDTLYGDAADAARDYAKQAAAAGISMNTYSEQAVSFGAALKNAYGGDVKKAAEAANTAILDMADNSAKMGTDIQSVQMAYQGFAKQNYTMLDNLKLGYGGTKTEMERLLADAEKLTGVKYNIDNLGDVYEAIHVIQGELGLTGVAAAEASETFSGSFNAMKASAQNFLGSLALGEGVQESLNQLMTSASTFFFGNFLPMMGTIIKQLPGAIFTFLQQGIPILVSNITSLVSNLATSLSSAANNLTADKVRTWITTTGPKILSAAASIIGQLAGGLVKNLPKIAAAILKIGAEIIKGLKSAVVNKIKSLFPVNIGKIFSNVKLPHFNISGKFSLNPPSTPKLSINWYAKGGIFDSAAVLGNIGVGEAGPEAILPLTPFWDRMDKIANSMQGGDTFNIYINGSNKDPMEIAEEVKRVLIKETNQRRLAWQ